MTWVLLIPVLVCLCVGSWLSYKHKDAVWFIPTFLALQLVCGLIWCWLSRIVDARGLYTFGLIWDVLAIAAYSVMPLMFCGVKLNWIGWTGFGLTILGVALVKWSE